ncbi:pyridoxamine 5'-phosphate oxidase family protein [Hamadaea sp. NPDC050747]|uniref:pyridoxamine 5'-phosphate oxidase family protein n=1 Tax=Hamadaea sp. NPDC050747 TaxID=3155789 RepID=UPI00340124F3
MRWMEFEKEQPRLAGLTRARLLTPGVVLVCTVRADGTPRLSPVEPYIMEGQFWLSMLWGSWKAKDLVRDPRILVHNIVTSRNGGGDGEVKVRGTAVPVEDHAVQERYAASVAETIGWQAIPGRFHLFAIDLTEVAYLHYDDATGDQYTVLWPQGAEFVRRGTSATSVGDPEPLGDRLLV